MVAKESGFFDLAPGFVDGDASQRDWPRLMLDADFADVVSLGFDDPLAARAAVIARNPAAAQRSSVPREVDPVTWLLLADDVAVDPAAAVPADGSRCGAAVGGRGGIGAASIAAPPL